ncbi:MAG: hypothetical protein HZB38_02445 [Planctomycetes bacterium]|nr:hypothetical protein [Planctomycetota bacterium]
MMRTLAIALLLGGAVLLLSGCDSGGSTAASLTEQLRMFAVEFARSALAAYLI